jgi:hypothetical protein
VGRPELFSEHVLYLVRRVRGHPIVADYAYAVRPARILSELAIRQASTVLVASVVRALATLNPTSYGRIVELLSNILTPDKKTERTAVLLKQGWITYKKGVYGVPGAMPISTSIKTGAPRNP